MYIGMPYLQVPSRPMPATFHDEGTLILSFMPATPPSFSKPLSRPSGEADQWNIHSPSRFL